MNEYYIPTFEDYLRTVILGMMYTCISQVLKFLVYELSSKVVNTRANNHFYWMVITVLKYYTIMALAYPQIGEVKLPTRSWNVSALQILIIALSISCTELVLNVVMIYLKESIVFNYFSTAEFESFENATEEHRRNSSISSIYKIKADLKQKEVYRKYYTPDEETENEESSTTKDHDLTKTTLFLDSQDSKLMSTASITLGFNIESNGDMISSHKSVKEPTHKNSRRKSKSASSRSGSIKSNSTFGETRQDKDKLLNLIGILNIPEFILNVEVPIMTDSNLPLASRFYQWLVSPQCQCLCLVWKLDSFVWNTFECFLLGIPFLFKAKRTAPVIISALIIRSVRYEVLRFFILNRFQFHEDDIEAMLGPEIKSATYGTLEGPLPLLNTPIRHKSPYSRDCERATYSDLAAGALALGSVVCIYIVL